MWIQTASRGNLCSWWEPEEDSEPAITTASTAVAVTSCHWHCSGTWNLNLNYSTFKLFKFQKSYISNFFTFFNSGLRFANAPMSHKTIKSKDENVSGDVPVNFRKEDEADDASLKKIVDPQASGWPGWTLDTQFRCGFERLRTFILVQYQDSRVWFMTGKRCSCSHFTLVEALTVVLLLSNFPLRL